MNRSMSPSLGRSLLRALVLLGVLPLGIASAHPQQGPTTYDDTDPSIVYSQGHNGDGQNGWATGSDPNDFGGGEHYSNGYSASFVVHFSGTNFSWIGKMGPNFGIASVFMDGQFQGTVDSYSPNVLSQQVLWSTSGMPDGVHVFQMKIGDYPSPATNPASSGWYQVLDGFTTSGTPLNLGGMISPADPSVTKIGTWSFGPNILSGQYCWSNDRSTPASLTFPFNGTGAEVYGHPEGEDGWMDVYIDGGYVTTVDLFNPLYDSIMSDSNDDSLLYVATGLPAGNHALQLVVAQGHNPNSLDYFTQIDGFMALPVPVGSPPPPTASVTFITQDTTTQGSWQGVYGTDGYEIVNDATNDPAYASVSVAGQNYFTWENPSSDPRALQKVTDSNRIAACWYQSGVFTIDVNLTDGAPHQVAIYALDWDFGNRTQTVQVLDAGTGTVLDQQSLSAFTGGVYLVWNIQGHVVIQVTWTGGYNAVVSGLFFDPPPAPSGGGTGPGGSSDPPAQKLASSSGSGACGLTGLETVLVLGLLVFWRRRKSEEL
jgi:hypothetical protein